MFRILPFIFLVGFLAGCTEIQYAAHMGKEWTGSLGSSSSTASASAAQGDFKVGKPYKINGHTYTPREQYDLVETGIASWYGPGFHGKKTANGERFDKSELTAAHRTLQMPSLVRVTNLDNGRSLIVRVNDRGPFKRGRIIDVSEKAAELLGFKLAGTAKVKLEVLPDESLRLAEMARSGVSTRGYENAANQQPTTSSGYQTASYDGDARMAGVEVEPLTAGHMKDGAFYPDPVVSQRVVSASNIYIQAGSFTVYDNALRLRDKLSTLANATVQPTDVRGQTFYRVRLGPAGTVNDADNLLSRVVNSGHGEAIIVVE